VNPHVGEEVWRRETPHVLAALVRRYGDIDACEDAVQEALVEASVAWPRDRVPEQPRGWLLRVASRRLIDERRQSTARVRREQLVALRDDRDPLTDPGPAIEQRDASLEVLALCCHPALTPESRVTLALRAVLGLTTKQIAAVSLIPAATAGQRISRAKATIDLHRRRFPAPATPGERLPEMLHALYLMYTSGHSLPTGPQLLDVTVTTEAIRLARLLHAASPDETEAAGLLALMLLSESRAAARTTPDGDLVQLAQQDRSRWDRAAIAEGVRLLERALPVGPVGPYQLQAAIAAVHADAPSWAETDWPQILELYAMLSAVAPSPTVTMNRAVAVGEVHGPDAALRILAPLLDDPRSARMHRLHAVRGALLEAAGRTADALDAYQHAGALCTSIPEQRFLNARISRLREPGGA